MDLDTQMYVHLKGRRVLCSWGVVDFFASLSQLYFALGPRLGLECVIFHDPYINQAVNFATFPMLSLIIHALLVHATGTFPQHQMAQCSPQECSLAYCSLRQHRRLLPLSRPPLRLQSPPSLPRTRAQQLWR